MMAAYAVMVMPVRMRWRGKVVVALSSEANFVEYTKHNPLFVYDYLLSPNSVYSTIYLDAYSNCTINIHTLNTVLKHLVFKPSSYNGNTLVL